MFWRLSGRIIPLSFSTPADYPRSLSPLLHLQGQQQQNPSHISLPPAISKDACVKLVPPGKSQAFLPLSRSADEQIYSHVQTQFSFATRGDIFTSSKDQDEDAGDGVGGHYCALRDLQPEKEGKAGKLIILTKCNFFSGEERREAQDQILLDIAEFFIASLMDVSRVQIMCRCSFRP